MKTFGIRTEGSEIELENTLKECISKFPNIFSFYEMGSASGITLKAVTDILKESGHDCWFAVGTDLSDGYTFNKEELLKNFNNEIHIIDIASQSEWSIGKNTTVLF